MPHVGRDRTYHGVGIAGISVGGMVANRKMFASMMVPGVDHLPHILNLSEMAFSRGQSKWGAHLAQELEKIPTKDSRDLYQARYFVDL